MKIVVLTPNRKMVNTTEYSLNTLNSLTWRYVGHNIAPNGEEMDIYNATGTNVYCIEYADSSIEYLEA